KGCRRCKSMDAAAERAVNESAIITIILNRQQSVWYLLEVGRRSFVPLVTGNVTRSTKPINFSLNLLSAPSWGFAAPGLFSPNSREYHMSKSAALRPPPLPLPPLLLA